MHAISLLARAKEEFMDRPLGGVFNVELTEIEWEKRMALAKVNWSTESYTLMEMRTALFKLKEKLNFVQGMTEASIDDRLALLGQLMDAK